MKDRLLDSVGVLLLGNGFTVKFMPRKWFDVVARKEGAILIIKVLADANSINKELAEEMMRISSLISGSPLIVAESAGEEVEDNVVYSRFGVCTISLNTMSDCIKGKLPFVNKKNSGLCVSISGNILSGIIEQMGLSLSEASRKMGVSKQMMMRYKSGQSEMSLIKAEKMRHVFGESVFRKLDVFSLNSETKTGKQSDVAQKYEKLGFRAVDTRKAPFDIIAKGRTKIILTEVGDEPKPELESMTKLIDAENLIIFEKRKPRNRSMPNISKESFLDMETESELIRFLGEFE